LFLRECCVLRTQEMKNNQATNGNESSGAHVMRLTAKCLFERLQRSGRTLSASLN
jgi:hypothetical protein